MGPSSETNLDNTRRKNRLRLLRVISDNLPFPLNNITKYEVASNKNTLLQTQGKVSFCYKLKVLIPSTKLLKS
jgi:hypothetical protein